MFSLKDLNSKGKRVFLRVDFNVPLDDSGSIRDDTRIKAALPTINFLLEQGAKLIIASHLGRPKGKFVPELSLKPVAKRLSELISQEVTLAPDVIGDEVTALKRELEEGQVLVLENVRFYSEETANDEDFARKLAQEVDYYVNDAFGACHRAHASVVAITRFVEKSAAGFLVEKEVDYLSKVVHSPQKPFVAVLGGAKVSDKIPVIESLLTKADVILIGGAMAYTFFKAQGNDVGRSLVEEDKIELAASILNKTKKEKIKFYLPSDHIIAAEADAKAEPQTVDSFPLPSEMMALDIGPKTIENYAEIISGAKTVFWNGPMGVFEIDQFSRGTTKIAEAVANSDALSIIGGGDSVAAVYKAGVADKISHISTGGGASLEFVANETLPGIEALTEK
ncbi:MAG: phosphoglycerate kinase [Candidatus Aminicenantes bacterium]|nr:phosphoglycerate kinase [Candidatus Aminicenantes bacterium]MDH5706998.1 phosphoglycerate kinase [Candidatus Aminicenantes bacterium]